MIDLKYDLTIEATEGPSFFGFYTGYSIEDCLYPAKWGMIEHVSMLEDSDFLSPARIRIRASLPSRAVSGQRTQGRDLKRRARHRR
jgi:hypothetical protein